MVSSCFYIIWYRYHFIAIVEVDIGSVIASGIAMVIASRIDIALVICTALIVDVALVICIAMIADIVIEINYR